MSSIFYTRVVINNKQRITGTARDFTVDLKESYGLQQISHIAVESITVPNLQYNVTSSTNSLRISIGASLTQTLTIEQGQYDISQFMLAIQNGLDTLSGLAEWTISQDAISRKIQFLNSNQTFTIFHTASTMYNEVGITDELDRVAVASGPNWVVVANRVPDLGGVSCAFIHSNALANSSTINARVGAISVLSYVSFADTPFGGLAHRAINDIELSKIRYSQPRNLSVVDIRVRTEDGSLIDMQNGEVQIVLRCYYEM